MGHVLCTLRSGRMQAPVVRRAADCNAQLLMNGIHKALQLRGSYSRACALVSAPPRSLTTITSSLHLLALPVRVKHQYGCVLITGVSLLSGPAMAPGAAFADPQAPAGKGATCACNRWVCCHNEKVPK